MVFCAGPIGSGRYTGNSTGGRCDNLQWPMIGVLGEDAGPERSMGGTQLGR